MKFPILLAVCVTALAPSARAVSALNSYFQIGTYATHVNEASAVTYNWDTNTLFVIGDEGERVAQISKTGQLIDSMAFDWNVSPRELRGLDDPEGITYLGNNTFMFADERDMMGRVTTYQAGGLRTQADLNPTSYNFDYQNKYGDTNNGLEGVAYDPVTNSVWGVKETSSADVYRMSGVPALTGDPGSAVSVTEPIARNRITRWNTNYGFNQLSDIYVLAASDAFSLDDPRYMNILLLSRNANLILEIDRAGNVIDSLDISGIGGQNTIEGITMDNDGILYLVSEKGGLHVLSAVPEPSTYALMVLGGLALWALRRRQQTA